MKMKSIFYTFIIVLIFLLFSCLSGNADIKVTFISYNNIDGRYSTKNEVVVKPGVKFGDIKRTEDSFEKDGFKYSFSHWTESISQKGSIETEAPAFDDESLINKSKTFYAVYSKEKIEKYTVTFKTFSSSSQGYYTIKTVSDISKDTPFNEIDTPNAPIINNYLGYNYTFKYWTVNSSLLSKPKTTGERITDETTIDDNITLYAVYTKKENKFTITFKYFDASSQTPSYTIKDTVRNIAYNTPFSQIQSPDDDIPQIDDYRGNKYVFKCWTKASPQADIPKTDGTEFTQNITQDIMLYAVYESEIVYYTVKFMAFDFEDNCYKVIKNKTDVRYDTKLLDIAPSDDTFDDKVVGGTKYSFFGWADIPNTETHSAMIEDFQKTKVNLVFPIQSSKTYYAMYQGDYLCFEAVEDTTISFYIQGQLPNSISLQYRIEGWDEFQDYTWGESTSAKSGYGKNITLSKDEKVYFKGNNQSFSIFNREITIAYVITISTGEFAASGSVMSLLSERDIIPENVCFFAFLGTDKLTQAPELPATTLSDNCYNQMFAGARLLETPPSLPATNLAYRCYYSMFKNCTSLTKAHNLPATRLYSSCYEYMFQGCSALIEAPDLPATTLAPMCYQGMFASCTSLVNAPVLPAKSLVKQCYYSMFENCTSLSSIKCLAETGFDENECLANWVRNVRNDSGTFTKKLGVTSWRDGVSGIPHGWNTEDVDE